MVVAVDQIVVVGLGFVGVEIELGKGSTIG